MQATESFKKPKSEIIQFSIQYNSVEARLISMSKNQNKCQRFRESKIFIQIRDQINHHFHHVTSSPPRPRLWVRSTRP
jgi:hypothetical protein